MSRQTPQLGDTKAAELHGRWMPSMHRTIRFVFLRRIFGRGRSAYKVLQADHRRTHILF